MTLTQNHWETLEAAANRIIPADTTVGAWHAGVGDYLARQFQGDLREQVNDYCTGLDALEREAQAFGGRRFRDLPFEQQDQVLSHVEAGQVVAAWPTDPARFFRVLVGHVMEGFYADPGNGGNRGGVSWRMIGFEVRG